MRTSESCRQDWAGTLGSAPGNIPYQPAVANGAKYSTTGALLKGGATDGSGLRQIHLINSELLHNCGIA